ncbi:unnamed protein product [Pedinophyceae sp. YPF-701]|nr:unnamed protein product [Pedinophyceae sp. YPF-701]
MGPRGRTRDLLDDVLREVPSVLDRLSDEDKVNLAATRWSTLEAVLRGCRAVLKVHLNDPVLQVLARRMEEGPCRGELATCGPGVARYGMRVAATDAGHLLEAVRKVGGPQPGSIGDLPEHNRQWIDLAWALTCGAENGEARVTGLKVPPTSDENHATMELAAIQHILASRPAREHLRRLEWTVQHSFPLPSDNGHIELLTKAMRGLSALQHVHLHAAPASWMYLIGEYSRLTTLELTTMTVSAHQMRALLDGLEQARELRHLRLECFYRDGDGVGGRQLPNALRAPPAGLEVLDVYDSTCPYDLREATSLRALVLTGGAGCDTEPWEEVAALMGRSKELRRVTVDDGTVSDSDVCAVFSALGRSTVEVFECAWEFSVFVDEEIRSALTEALVSGLRNNRTLRELALSHEAAPGEDDLFLDVPKVAAALKDSGALRRLKLDSAAITDDDVVAIAESLPSMRSLEELDLGSIKHVTGKGLQWAGNSLRVLRLQGAQSLGKEGLRDVLSSLCGGYRGGNLHKLQISGSSIGGAGAERVAAVLEHPACSLRTLSLTNSGIGDAGAEGIAGVLGQNRSLVSLNLTGNRLTDRGQKRLAAALADNSTLRFLELGECYSSWGPSPTPLAGQVLHAQHYALAMRHLNTQHMI